MISKKPKLKANDDDKVVEPIFPKDKSDDIIAFAG